MPTMTTRPRGPGRHGVVRNTAETELWLYDQIDGWGGDWGISAREFLADLRTAGSGPCSLHINSPGGDAFDALAIYEALRLHPGRVTVYIDGLAASAASFIAMAGDEVVMSPGGQIMIHDALTMTHGNEADHLAAAAVLGQVSDTIADIYAARAGGTRAAWRSVMRAEHWFAASAAVGVGLADRVAPLRTPASPAARAHLRAANSAHRLNLSATLSEAFREAIGTAAVLNGPGRRPYGRRSAPSVSSALARLQPVARRGAAAPANDWIAAATRALREEMAAGR